MHKGEQVAVRERGLFQARVVDGLLVLFHLCKVFIKKV